MNNSESETLFHYLIDKDKKPNHEAKRIMAPVRTASSRDENKKLTEAEPEEEGFKLEFTIDNIMNGIILAELLGKPKILQKRRW